MPVLTMPQLGESDVEGTVIRWLKAPGEQVRAEEPLVEIETEKVTVEIPSPFAGVLTRVLVQEGDTVPVGADLAIIADEAEAPPPAQGAVDPAVEPRATSPSPVSLSAAAEPTAAAPTVATPRIDRGSANGAVATNMEEQAGRPRYSPAVLRLANEHRVDLASIPGTGLNGRVTRKDVVRFVEEGGARLAAASPTNNLPAEGPPTRRALDTTLTVPAASAQAPPQSSPATTPAAGSPPAPAARDDEEIIRPSITRLTIARNMVRAAQTIPTAWMVVETDVTGLVRLRERWREEFRRREGTDLTYLPFVIQAVVQALGEQPLLNSQWRDDQIVLKKRINIGIAVGSEDGLIVPVIHEAGRLSIAGLAHAVSDLAERTRSRKLRLEDVQGGTFTVDNTGVFGSLISQPIINPPQCAILSTEAIMRRPVVRNDAIAIRSMMNLCISFDHRIVDGSHVGPFMLGIKRRLEAITADVPLL